MANQNTVAGLYNLAGPISSTETCFAAVAGGTTRAILGVRQDQSSGFFDGHIFKIHAVKPGDDRRRHGHPLP